MRRQDVAAIVLNTKDNIGPIFHEGVLLTTSAISAFTNYRKFKYTFMFPNISSARQWLMFVRYVFLLVLFHIAFRLFPYYWCYFPLAYYTYTIFIISLVCSNIECLVLFCDTFIVFTMSVSYQYNFAWRSLFLPHSLRTRDRRSDRFCRHWRHRGLS